MFKSLEEEREYWEAHGLLATGRKGRLNKPKTGQKRSSFLAVRLTGEELTRLRDTAAKQGLGPSTFARVVLTSAIGKPSNVVDLTDKKRLQELARLIAAELFSENSEREATKRKVASSN